MPSLDKLLGEGGKKVAIGARETDAVVFGRGLNCLLMSCLVLLKDANQSLDRPI